MQPGATATEVDNRINAVLIAHSIAHLDVAVAGGSLSSVNPVSLYDQRYRECQRESTWPGDDSRRDADCFQRYRIETGGPG